MVFVLVCCDVKEQDPNTAVADETSETTWKAGVAGEIITPKTDLWMSGYAARDKPAQGKIHDLWVKALAIEDRSGHQAIFVTCDIVGFPRELSQSICRRLQEKHKLERADIVLSSSHNHSGPVVNENLFLIYPPFDEEQKEAIHSYIGWLEDAVVDCGSRAIENLVPAKLSSGIGIARFAVNRRNNNASDVLNSSDLRGPVDHTVSVIKVCDPNGELHSLLFGYACHATTLDLCEWSGDYPGFAQIELEDAFPGSKALFFAGCGGDQNPIPRRSVSLAEQYGEELASAVKRVLKEPMKELKPDLNTHYSEITLAFSESPSIAELQKIAENGPAYEQRWAGQMISKINENVTLPGHYPYYPIQNWRIGDQRLLMLGGEVVVDYAIRLKQGWGNDLFIVAYANDVMAYIPSLRVLNEGGYEGETSMRVYNQPSTWAPEIEEKIIAEVGEQLKPSSQLTSTIQGQ